MLEDGAVWYIPIPLQAAREVVVDNVPDVRLVDAHSKRNRGGDLSSNSRVRKGCAETHGRVQYRDILLLHEPILNLHSLLRSHAGMIRECSNPGFSQRHGNIFGLLETAVFVSEIDPHESSFRETGNQTLWVVT